jgi:Fur family transcriptional regulator, ferric uptake regulator
MARSEQQPPARAWQESALAALEEGGYRAGGARGEVIELLTEQGGCLDAESVNERLRSEGRRVGTASVYRALGLLSDLGLLRKVTLADSPARFELVMPGGEHHHHIVCDRCGATAPFSDESLERAIEEVSDRASFEVEAHEITLHGTCARCLTEAT